MSLELVSWLSIIRHCYYIQYTYLEIVAPGICTLHMKPVWTSRSQSGHIPAVQPLADMNRSPLWTPTRWDISSLSVSSVPYRPDSHVSSSVLVKALIPICSATHGCWAIAQCFVWFLYFLPSVCLDLFLSLFSHLCLCLLNSTSSVMFSFRLCAESLHCFYMVVLFMATWRVKWGRQCLEIKRAVAWDSSGSKSAASSPPLLLLLAFYFVCCCSLF